MDILRIAAVGRYDHGRMGDRAGRVELRLAEAGPAFAALVARNPVGMELGEDEGQVVVAEKAAPVGDQPRKQGGVLFRKIAVALALIPDDAANGQAAKTGEHLFVEHRRIFVMASDAVVDLADGGFQRRIGCEGFRTDPCFGRRAAVRTVDDAYRNAQFTVQLPGEKVGYGAPVVNVPSVGSRPGTVGGVELFAAADDVGPVVAADVGVVGIADQGEAVVELHAADFEGHVRLSPGQPDLAHQNVADRHGLAAGPDFHRAVLVAGLQSRNRDLPYSLCIGFRRDGMSGK